MEDLRLARENVEGVAAQEVVDHDLDLGEGEAPAAVVSYASQSGSWEHETYMQWWGPLMNDARLDVSFPPSVLGAS